MTWLFDSRRFAKKVKNPSGLGSFSRSGFEDNGKSTSCPSCGQEITPGTYVQEWPGLPAGVKFDPGDKELLDHLAAKVGHSSHKLHPLIDEFIPTLDSEDGICYTHPEKLPGIKRDGSSSHFFHKPSNAYTKGTRKRRKVQTGDEAGETRWHKTGKTRPVTEGGKQIGCKKIMVLYTNFKKNNKPEKTNWVMHQYHLGTQEEEKEGELVVSKVFYQTQPRSSTTRKSNAFDEEEVHDEVVEEQLHEDPGHSNVEEVTTSTLTKVLPITPQAYTPFRPWSSRTRLPIIPHSRLDIQEQNIPVSDSTLTAYINSSQKVQVNTNIVQGELDDMSSFVSHKTTHPNPEVITCAQVNQTLSNHDVEVTGGENMETPSAQYSDAAVELQVDDMIASSVYLLCDEKLHCDLDLLDTAFDQDFRNFASELGLTIDEESDDIARDATASALDNIFLDTPPEMLEDPFISSQELLDWIGRKKINLRAEPTACLETFADSQSST